MDTNTTANETAEVKLAYVKQTFEGKTNVISIDASELENYLTAKSEQGAGYVEATKEEYDAQNAQLEASSEGAETAEAAASADQA